MTKGHLKDASSLSTPLPSNTHTREQVTTSSLLASGTLLPQEAVISISHVSQASLKHYVAKDVLPLLILLPLSPKYRIISMCHHTQLYTCAS